MSAGASFDPAALRFDDRGLVTVVAQDVATGAVLMVAHADREAVRRTLDDGVAWFWSRSRGALWRKGETSGNTLHVVAAHADCDGDVLLLRVDAAGPACHTGSRTCFGEPGAGLELGWLEEIVAARRAAVAVAGVSAPSYTAGLFAEGLPRIAQKVGEEAVETVIAALDVAAPEARERLAGEAADLLFHLLVLLQARDVRVGDVARVLRQRHVARTHSQAEVADEQR